jgi:hypothetical protein
MELQRGRCNYVEYEALKLEEMPDYLKRNVRSTSSVANGSRGFPWALAVHSHSSTRLAYWNGEDMLRSVVRRFVILPDVESVQV